MPYVVNKHHYSGEYPDILPEPSLYVGRPSPLGNPYTKEYLERWADTRPAVKARVKQDPMYLLEPFKRHLWAKLQGQDPGVIRMMSQIEEDTHLVCHCVRPDGSGVCHAKVIVQAWEWWWAEGCPGLVVAIVGSKSWPEFGGGQYIEVNNLLLRLPRKARIIARHVEGLDTYAVEAARHFDFAADFVEVDREKHGKGAEFKRDFELVHQAHWVYAFNLKSTGTQHIIDLATQAKIPLEVSTTPFEQRRAA